MKITFDLVLHTSHCSLCPNQSPRWFFARQIA